MCVLSRIEPVEIRWIELVEIRWIEPVEISPALDLGVGEVSTSSTRLTSSIRLSGTPSRSAALPPRL